MSLNFPLSVRWKKNCFFLSQRVERGCVFSVFFAPFLEMGILDYIAHGIQLPRNRLNRGGRNSALSVELRWTPLAPGIVAECLAPGGKASGKIEIESRKSDAWDQNRRKPYLSAWGDAPVLGKKY